MKNQITLLLFKAKRNPWYMNNLTGLCAPSSSSAEENKFISKIVEHEGIRYSAYQDTKGYWTIGIGTCIDDCVKCGLTKDECYFLLSNRISIVRNKLTEYSWFKLLDETRKNVMVELAFNIGVSGILGFKKMVEALSNKNYKLATKELLDSQWQKQVGEKRSRDMAYRLLNGEYET